MSHGNVRSAVTKFGRWTSFAILVVGGIMAIRSADAEENGGTAAKGPEPPAGMFLPKYTDDGKLRVPENYRGWVFVGASVGLSYDENVQKEADAKAAAEGVTYSPGLIHQTYTQSEAYAHFLKTGEFPEKTMMVLEVYESVQKVQPDTKGFSSGKRLALEVSVKNHERVEEGWAYYNFALRENKPAESAKNFPKGMCFACHDAHANDDHVFTQFYPVLQEAKALRGAEQAGAAAGAGK